MKKNGVVNKVREVPGNIKITDFEASSGNAVSVECNEMIAYPAITTGLLIEPHCLTKKAQKEEKKSWLEKIFGE